MGATHNPYAERVDEMPGDKFMLLEWAVAARLCREHVGFGTFDEAAAAFRPRPGCPRCKSRDVVGDGRTPAGRRRFRCRACGARFSAPSGTVFEGCKKDLPTWARFVELMTWNVPLDAACELCGITHQTAFEWRHRVFATVRGYTRTASCSGAGSGSTRYTSTTRSCRRAPDRPASAASRGRSSA